MPPRKNRTEAEIYVCFHCRTVIARCLPRGVILTETVVCPYCTTIMVQSPRKGHIEWNTTGS